MSSKYSQKLLDHFNNPRNVGIIDDADAVGRERNDACGDTTTLYLKIRDATITDAKFQTFGCGPAIATSSVATEMIIGRRVDDAAKITRRDLVDALDGLPPTKIHCSVLAADALKKALEDYRRRTLSGSNGS